MLILNQNRMQVKNMKSLNTGMINKTMGIREWSLILVLSIIWGGSFFFVEVAVKERTVTIKAQAKQCPGIMNFD
jgi:hypothetical protein